MKIAIIIPYFGKFPNYFQLFLNSCSYNKSFCWIIFTDNKDRYRYPDNVKLYYFTFDMMKDTIQSKFDFTISLESKHKLCEYKPAYGYIFEQYIKNYDYWGYGDLDLIYGNLNEFINEKQLTYDKIFTLGHLTLIRNSYDLNRIFMKEIYGRALYKEAFSSEMNYNFDEDFLGKANINDIFEKYGKTIYDNKGIADIYTKSSKFRLTHKDKTSHKFIVEKNNDYVFCFDNGRLLRYGIRDNRLQFKEYAYIHLQKRKMKLKSDAISSRRYLIIPNAFVSFEQKITLSNYYSVRKKYFNLHYFRLRYSNLITKVKNLKMFSE